MDENAPQGTPDNDHILKPTPETAESQPLREAAVNTAGGAIIQGDVRVEGGGDFVGRDKILITEEASYDVRGLPNPYLGLRAFVYNDRAAFGGREGAIREAVAKLTKAGARQNLLFITGASGSGKSSLAQAGLLPALEAHYAERRKQVFRAVFRPSSDPLAMLADALGLLGLPDLSSQELARFTPEEFALFLGEHTPKDQVNLLVIDQFEEFFTQSAPGQRDAIFGFLANLPDFAQTRTHLIATIRSDFLDELFNHKELWDIAKGGMELRAMSQEELQEAIQQPLFAACTGEGNGKKPDERYCQKRFDLALLERLSQDACQEAAFLPLLQVTLQEIWNTGTLKLGEYGSLTDAIQKRAELVYNYEDYQVANPQKERPPEDQAAIMDIFLDLVDVALDDDLRRDVRRRRSKNELVSGSVQRPRLVSDLIEARLLSASIDAVTEGHVETVDIIHESLINSWIRLRAAILERRNALQRRARFEIQLAEWSENGRSDDYTLAGIRLAEARDLERQGDIALRGEEARNFLRRSLELVEAAQRRELEQARALAEAQHRRVRVARGFTVGLSIALLLALFAAGFAWRQTNRAIAQQALSRSRELAALSIATLDSDLELSLLLAMLSIGDPPYTLQSQDALRRVLLSPTVELTLQGHTGAVYSVAYDSQGQRLVTASADRTARIWDAATGRELLVLSGHTKSVNAAAFNPDGRLVATVGADKMVRLWDAQTGQQLRSMEGHGDAINSVSFSPDGQRIVTASNDATARIWDVATGRQVFVLNHTAPVHAAVFSPQGKFIATGGNDANIDVWDAATGQLIESIYNNGERVNAIVFSPDDQYLIADWLYAAYRWDIQSAQVVQSYAGSHNWYLTGIALSPDGELVATASRDHTVHLWDAGSGSEIVGLRGHGETVYSVAFDPAGDQLATASADQMVRIWDLAGWRKRVLLVPSFGFFDAVYSQDSTRIATVSSDGKIRIWDAQSGHELKAWQYPSSPPASGISFSPDDRQLITSSDDGTWRIWDVDTGEQVYGSPPTNIVHDARFNRDGTRIITTDRDDFGYIWDADTKQLLARLEGHTSWVATGMFSPDGQLVVTASADGTARLWDAYTGQPIRVLSGHSDLVVEAAFSSDGKRIVTASVDGTARIWDTATGETLHILKGHSAQLTDAVFSPDDRYVATSSSDDTVRIWDAATGSELIQLLGHTNDVLAVNFSPDGRYLLTAGYDGKARIYLVRFEEEVALGRSLLSKRELYCAERVKYLHEECPAASPVITPAP